jgi:hypothetical protein
MNDAQVHKMAEFKMPQFTVVSSIALDIEHAIVICGSREGALLVYDIQPVLSKSDAPRLVWERRRTHERNTVTWVVIRERSDHTLEAWTTGRDGAYVQWYIHIKDHQDERHIELERALRSRVTKGWLERVGRMNRI